MCPFCYLRLLKRLKWISLHKPLETPRVSSLAFLSHYPNCTAQQINISNYQKSSKIGSYESMGKPMIWGRPPFHWALSGSQTLMARPRLPQSPVQGICSSFSEWTWQHPSESSNGSPISLVVLQVMSYKSYIGYIVPIVLAKEHNLLPPAAMFEYQTWNPPVVASGRTHNIWDFMGECCHHGGCFWVFW